METLLQRHIDYDRTNFTDGELVDIYKRILKPRLIEEKMLILLRQGKISKWFSGWGQEAISVGTTLAMQKDEVILPMHRNLGVFTTRDIPLERLFAQFQGKMSGFTKGRDRSFHFGTMDYNIVGMISHLGPQLGIADGIALASNIKKEGKATLVFSGDGGASEGDFHEALNVAAVWQLPTIFTIENNQWGLSTPSNEQFRFKQFVDKGIGYGMDAFQIDGNNILEVITSVKQIAESIRERPRPFLLECLTFRMRGHEEASGTKYYPEGIQDEWSKKDPVVNYELFLKEEGLLTDEMIADFSKEIKDEIQNGLDVAGAEPKIIPDTETEIKDLFKEYNQVVVAPESENKSEKRLVDAVSDGLRQSMERFPELVLMGQDIGDYGGVFKVTEGFVEQFGKDRVRNTPLCESAIIGAGLGLSIAGMKAMVEMQFSDFVTVGFNQIVNNLAKLHWRWGQNADVVVRMPTGAGVAAGPFHSQSTEAWFFHTPGLKIVYPAFPGDAKGLLAAAIEDPNPVLFFEHKFLYRSLREDIYDDYYTTEIGKAAVLKKGTDVTIVTYGLGVHWALETLENDTSISADLIDLRTLAPLDMETVIESVKKTGRVIVLHEDVEIGGIGAEIVTQINEACFKYLDAPIRRVASLNTPIPFEADLEKNFLPNKRFETVLTELLNY
ncbi:alpha-ketoacid dehydrogenase subunit alpha/beta [Brumimicrobium mesophilum]|uniref:alpha-ketoacid dehydrogenase subunit alpha/beta n=1 Tax=Brumimicrobium mesophilum TaxID=392717 RepID=UPI000D1412B0|nr:dehydrogenase E1 component subunit alpha/beta [Brumimicrobium mesophilum]